MDIEHQIETLERNHERGLISEKEMWEEIDRLIASQESRP